MLVAVVFVGVALVPVVGFVLVVVVVVVDGV